MQRNDKKHDIDITCLAETHTNWRHYKGRRQLGRIVRNNWKRSHLIVSNIDNKGKHHYQPGGIAIITTNTISPRITDSGEDPHNKRR